MKAQFITLFLLIISIPFSFSQVNITGSVVDAYSNEDLIGAIIIYGKGKSVSADIDGNFKFNIPKGERTITVRYLGYTSETKTIYAEGKIMVINFNLKNLKSYEAFRSKYTRVDHTCKNTL